MDENTVFANMTHGWHMLLNLPAALTNVGDARFQHKVQSHLFDELVCEDAQRIIGQRVKHFIPDADEHQVNRALARIRRACSRLPTIIA